MKLLNLFRTFLVTASFSGVAYADSLSPSKHVNLILFGHSAVPRSLTFDADGQVRTVKEYDAEVKPFITTAKGDVYQSVNSPHSSDTTILKLDNSGKVKTVLHGSAENSYQNFVYSDFQNGDFTVCRLGIGPNLGCVTVNMDICASAASNGARSDNPAEILDGLKAVRKEFSDCKHLKTMSDRLVKLGQKKTESKLSDIRKNLQYGRVTFETDDLFAANPDLENEKVRIDDFTETGFEIISACTSLAAIHKSNLKSAEEKPATQTPAHAK